MYINYHPAMTFGPVYIPPRALEQQHLKFVSQRLGLGLLIMQGVSGIFSVALTIALVTLQLSDQYSVSDLLSDSVGLLNLNVIITVPMFILSFAISAKMLHTPLGEFIPMGKVPAKILAAFTAVSLACAMIGNVVSDYMANLLSQLGLESASPDLGESDGSLLSAVIMALTVAAVPALVEEFAFRGVFMGALRRFGDLFAVVISAMFFGLIHGNLAQAPFAFIVGLALGYSVIATGSMWPAIIAHFLNNFVSVILDSLADKLGYNAVNLIFAAYMILIIIIGLFAAYWLFRKQNYSLKSKNQTILYTSEKIKAFFSAPAMIISLIILILNIVSTMAMNMLLGFL